MKKFILTTIAVATLSTTAIALTNKTPAVESQDKTPLESQIEDHEVRIDGLETKTDNIQAEVDKTQNDVTIIKQSTGTNSAAVVTPHTEPKTEEPASAPLIVPPAPVAQPDPEPIPVPEPTPDNLTITAVNDLPKNANLHTCTYTLYDGRSPRVTQPITLPCQQVGEILTGVNGY